MEQNILKTLFLQEIDGCFTLGVINGSNGCGRHYSFMLPANVVRCLTVACFWNPLRDVLIAIVNKALKNCCSSPPMGGNWVYEYSDLIDC